MLFGSAIPVVLLDRWLDNFAYRVDVSWFPYFWTLFVLLFILLLTVGLQSWKVAQTDPVKSLRTE